MEFILRWVLSVPVSPTTPINPPLDVMYCARRPCYRTLQYTARPTEHREACRTGVSWWGLWTELVRRGCCCVTREVVMKAWVGVRRGRLVTDWWKSADGDGDAWAA